MAVQKCRRRTQAEVVSIEDGVSRVTNWILGPGETLLNARQNVGYDVSSAEDLKRNHESLELRCREPYSRYAEILRKLDVLARSGTKFSEDLRSQKDFMDFVCRSFASRVERRRNILITSARFFRLVSEYFQVTSAVYENVMMSVDVEQVESAENDLEELLKRVKSIDTLERELVGDGEKLSDLLSMPVKDAFGTELPVDYRDDIANVREILEMTIARKQLFKDSVELHALTLRQLVHIRNYEKTAVQAIKWLNELYAVLMKSHSHIGSTVREILSQKEEHERFQETAKGTFEFACQLLRAALALRQSCKLSERHNTQFTRDMWHSWKRLYRVSQEQLTRLRVSAVFHRNVDEYIGQLRKLTEDFIISVVDQETDEKRIRLRNILRRREHILLEVGRTIRLGRLLKSRLREPLHDDNNCAGSKVDIVEKNETAIFAICEKSSEVTILAEQLDTTLCGFKFAMESDSIKKLLEINDSACQSWKDSSESGSRSDGNKSDDDLVTASECAGSGTSPSRASSFHTASEGESASPWWDTEASSSPENGVATAKPVRPIAQRLEKATQSKKTLELKLLELEPDLISLGQTYEEASQLELAHEDVLQRLQNKRSPVEELLKKADQVIADQKPQAEVYAAMADSLGQAWKDINALLLRRKRILHLNVAFHEKAETCVERMKVLEMLCLSPIPSGEQMVRENLSHLQEVKKSMLECLMAALKSAQSLSASMNEIVADDSIDSRFDRYKRAARSALAQVERWLELLHNRRRLLDVTWQRRKLNLEKHRTLSILKCDLELLESLIRERYELLSRARNELGDSASSAQFLLEQHQRLIPEATNLQEEGLRMLKASQTLPASSHTFSPESNERSYSVLNLANEYLQAANDREDLLKRSIRFFNSAKSVTMKLEEMNYQLKNVNNPSERPIITNMTEEITKNIINEGRFILKKEPGAKFVKRALEEIENFRLRLISGCVGEKDENDEICGSISNVCETNDRIFSWLVTVVEPTLKNYRDMGENLDSARCYLQCHQKLLDELRRKKLAANESAGIIAARMYEHGSPSSCDDDVESELNAVADRYSFLKRLLEERVKVSQKFVEFHWLAESVARESHLFAKSPSSKFDSKEATAFRHTFSTKIQRVRRLLAYAAQDFLLHLSRSRDSYLDTKRARACVETVLEDFSNRKSNIEAKLNFWKRSKFHEESGETWWFENMADGENTVDWVAKLESQLYPVLNGETTSTGAQVEQVNDKLRNVIPQIERAQQEIETRIKTAQQLIAEGNVEGDEEVPPKLNELYDSICSIVVEYSTLVEMFSSFLKNVEKMEKIIEDLGAIEEPLGESSMQQLSEVEAKLESARKSFRDLWDIVDAESRTLTAKIKEQEPCEYAQRDVETMVGLLENTKSACDNLSARLQQSLKRRRISKEFDGDLESIETSVDELSEELRLLRHQYSRSLSAAEASSQKFQYFEKTIRVLEEKIESFVNTAGEVLRVSESRSDEIENQLDRLKRRWHELCSQVSETRRAIDSSIRYFSLLEEMEECLREGTKLLVRVARKSSSTRTAEEAECLSRDMRTFTSQARVEQRQRIERISEIAGGLFQDDPDQARRISAIVAENDDMLESFSTVSRELCALQRKLEISVVPDELQVEVEAVGGVAAEETIESPSGRADTRTPASPSSPPFKKTKFFDVVDDDEFRKPFFVSPLENSRVGPGRRFVFDCEVDGCPTPRVSWLKDGVPVADDDDDDVAAAANYTASFENGVCRLTLERVSADDAATFACRATNEAGTVQSSATLSVLAANSEAEDDLLPPSFVVTLSDARIPVGRNCELYCKVTGNPLPVVRWFKDDVCVDSWPNYEITFNNGDARLLIEEATMDVGAMYACTAVNPLGSDTTTAQVAVEGVVQDSDSAVPSFSACLSDAMARAGQKLKLECAVMGNPFPSLLWLCNGKAVEENSNITMRVDSDTGKASLTVAEAFPRHAGSYTLVATNAAGEARCGCDVTVAGLPPCGTSDSEAASDAEAAGPSIKRALNDVSVREGESALLECVIVGYPEPEVIWYHNEIPVKESNNIRLLFEGDECSVRIEECGGEDAGVYKAVAVNSAGEASTACCLTVLDSKKYISNVLSSDEFAAPKFTRLLTDVLVREGDAAVLECAVSGHPEPEVRWFLNKSEIVFSNRIKCERSGDGNITLTVNNAVPEDKGLYTARAVNSVGEAKCFSHVIVKSLSSRDTKSSDIHLEDKFEYPSFVQSFADQNLRAGMAAKFECIVSGKPSPKVRWLFNNEPVSGKSFLVSTSGDRQVLSIPEVSEQTDGIVTCVVENEVGKNTCVARLRVVADVTMGSLMPSFENGTNIYESSKSYAIQKLTIEKSATSNDTPVMMESNSFVKLSEQASEKLNDRELYKVESHQLVSDRGMNGKAHDFSSQCLASGNADLRDKIRAGERCSIVALKPARKQTAPRFLTTIDNAIVDVGRKVRFEAVLESYPPAQVAWYKNNRALSAEPGKIEISWRLNRASLQISDVDSSDAGRFTCCASNGAGSASCSADLFVKKTAFPPVMGKRLHPQSAAVSHRVTFEVEVTGTPSPTVTWFKDDTQLAKVSPFYRLREQGNSFALIIEKARFEDSGQYKAKASNEAGEAVSIAPLHIFDPPESNADGYQIKHGSSETMFGGNQTATINKFETNTTELSELNTNYSGEFSEKIEVSKTNKHVSFNADGQKLEDSFGVGKNENEHRLGCNNSAKSVATWEEFMRRDEKNFHSTEKLDIGHLIRSSNEIEELQKPIIYSNNLNSYSSYAANSNREVYLEPGPPPELGYIPKEAVVTQKREPVAERVKKLESCTRELSPVEIPAGAVKIFPTIISKSGKEAGSCNSKKKYSSYSNESENTTRKNTSTEQSRHSEIFYSSAFEESSNPNVDQMETCKSTAYRGDATRISRPSPYIESGPVSSRLSADDIGTQKSKSQSQKKRTEELISTDIRPVTPYNCRDSKDKAFEVSDIKRSLSPLPSAEGVAMDKLWAHPIHLDKRSRPHSVIGGISSDTVPHDNAVPATPAERSWPPCDSNLTRYSSRHTHDDLHTANDQVISQTKFDETITDDNRTKSVQPTISERTKLKKFKWPPREVRIEDSLVRKGFRGPISPAICNSVSNAGDQQYSGRTEHSISEHIEPMSEKYLPGVRSVPYPPSKTASYETREFCSNQTLPRSFKFASSYGSKFKPVNAYHSAPNATEQRLDSDYESDFEVTKISKQAHRAESNLHSSSSKYLANADGAATVSNRFVTNMAIFSRSDPSKKVVDSGYAADTDEPAYLKGRPFASHSLYPRTTSSSASYQNFSEQNKTRTFPRISDKKMFLGSTSRKASPSAALPSPSTFVKCDVRESDYESDLDGRIPPIWRPSDSEPDEPCYRPVRPNLQSAGHQRPRYCRTVSADAASSSAASRARDAAADLESASPAAAATEHRASVKAEAGATFDRQCGGYGAADCLKRPYARSHSGGDGDGRWPRGDAHHEPPSGRFGGWATERCSRAEYVDQSSFTDYRSQTIEKVRKVEKIRKCFESCGGSFSGHLSSSKYWRGCAVGLSALPPLVHLAAIRYNHNSTSSNETEWVSDMTRSNQVEFFTTNAIVENNAARSIPIFTTPLRDIAAVIGSSARFECIVQTDSPFTIEWRRNGEVVRDSELCQLSHRNGVCRLALSKTYMYDAGAYQCIVTNRAGSAETSATLTVSGERRSHMKK